MTTEAQRIAIAASCGYKWYKTYRAKYGRKLQDPFGERMLLNDAQSQIHLCEPTDDITLTINLNGVPDYLTDLNAMHEAEKVLLAKHLPHYTSMLRDLMAEQIRKNQSVPLADIYEWHATAAQRAEAFLRTLNPWAP